MLNKDQIIKEIKRTARENSGKPLGYKSFQKETGIGPFEWGRYWPRFGDALLEAGFKPNQAWTRIPDEILVKSMIKKIRKFGKYPTIGEMRIEGDKDIDFPYHIIKKRKQEYIVSRILEYCRNKPSYKDIIKFCDPVVKKFEKQEKIDDALVNDRIGEVYLYKSGRNYKIGKSNDTVRRGNELRIQLPEKLSLIHTIKTDDPSGVEAYWHKRFESKRMQGEWFDLSSADIKAFKRWRKIV